MSACSTSGGESKTNDTSSGHIKSVTAITEVFGDGQKVSAVALQYDSAIDTFKLNTSDFKVEGKIITKVYANTEAKKSDKGINGKYVIAELDTTIKSDSGSGSNNGQNGNAQQSTSQSGGNQAPGSAGPKLGEKATDSAESKPLTVNITQSGDIETVGGQIYKADSKVMAST
ncbi:hypothetical protein ACJDU8_25100, partial [Clostridium sp. WILCCON 0269]